MSIEAQEAFSSEVTKISENLDFSDALRILKAGGKITRPCWDDRTIECVVPTNTRNHFGYSLYRIFRRENSKIGWSEYWNPTMPDLFRLDYQEVK